MLQTEYDFELPRGYLDDSGTLHRRGTMRLATAADEILPMRDPRVQQNPEYLPVVLFTRVVTRLGTLPALDTKIVERLFLADMSFLQDLYNRINTMDTPVYKSVCPHCGKEIEAPVNFTAAE